MKFKIKGLNKEKVLRGEVAISGSKNAALPALASTILFKGEVKLKNIPDNEDIKRTTELLIDLGAEVRREKENLIINTDQINKIILKKEIASKMRASIMFVAPLLFRFGEVSFPTPGGCVIGERPIDLTLKNLEKFGAKVTESKIEGDYYTTIKLEGGETSFREIEIFFNQETVSGTENLILASTLFNGKVVLKNCALEPEVSSLANFLKDNGLKIEGVGTNKLEIKGQDTLLKNKKDFVNIPDRIEAGSYLFLTCLLGDNVLIKDCEPEHLEVVINLLKGNGVNIEVGKDYLRVDKSENLKSFNIKTHEYPGFPTDLQAIFGAYAVGVKGDSSIFETIYEGRLKYIEEIIKMGGRVVEKSNREVTIKGEQSLEGAELYAHDIRAGFATIILALYAKGDSMIDNVYLINRGYEDIIEKLEGLGVKIELV